MPRYAYLLLLVLLNICSPLSALQKVVAAVPSFKGQAFTLLSDGHILATGGFDDSGKELSDAYLVDAEGTSQKLASGLLHARGFHSATVLPDGTVLIFGGTDGSGNYLRLMELYNPQTEQFTAWTGLPLVPRASHTATLLTDGRLVVVGGTGEGGSFPQDIQFLDYRTGRVEALHAGPSLQRQGHSARLMADGTVLIEGGRDIHGLPVNQAEVYNPFAQAFAVVTPNDAPINDQEFSFTVKASDPTDGASAYPVEDYLKVRLSRLADVTTVNEQTVILKNANGTAISATVAAAEQGRLIFVVPDTSLEAGSNYTLTLQGITDAGSSPLPVTTIHFQTADDMDDGQGDGWYPDSAALAGDWGSRSGGSDWEKLTPLHAPANVTALAGQALGLSGKPLSHVTLQIDSHL